MYMFILKSGLLPVDVAARYQEHGIFYWANTSGTMITILYIFERF
jgi:hypothetical protein